MWCLAARGPVQTISCMRHREFKEGAEPCVLTAKVVATQTWLIETSAQDSKAVERSCVDLVDIIKVLLGDSDPELIELGHVGVIDHPVSQDTLTLMHPQAHHLDRLLVVVLSHTQQPLYQSVLLSRLAHAHTCLQYKWC